MITYNKYSLYAIDNGNIWNKQHVEAYGKLPFVKQYNVPEYYEVVENFPFTAEKDLNEEEIKYIVKFSNWDQLQEKITKKISNVTNKSTFKYVLYNKGVWVQEDNEINPYAQNLDKTVAKDILKELESFRC